MSDFKNQENISMFYNYGISALERSDLGTKGFSIITSKLDDARQMIDEMIVIIENNENIPKGVSSQIHKYVNEFNNFAKLIEAYDLDTDARNNFNQRTGIINNVERWVYLLYSGTDADRNFSGFMVLYNSLKMYNLLALQKDKADIEVLKENLESSNAKAIELLNLLQSRVTSVAVSDYAAIFEQQALKHSQFKVWPIKAFKLGLAQIWLIVAVLLVIGFAYFIKHENDFLPFDVNNVNITVITLQLLTRILIISFSIYIISLAFKQYNVQNHLQTLNQHRQNTLNSYKLFIESLDGNDPVTKNALMMEVAKSIYEAGPSGYLNNKDNDNGPSIIELTKFVGQSK